MQIFCILIWNIFIYRQVPKLRTLNVKTRFASLTY